MEWCADWLCLVLGTRFSTPVNSQPNNKNQSTSKAPKDKHRTNISLTHINTNHLTLYRNMLIFVMDQISAIDLKLAIQVWMEGSALCVVVLAHNLAKLVQV